MCEETDENFRHAEWVVQKIHDLLKSAGVGVKDLSGLIVGVGPGSFTGLRVGLAVAKALMMSLEISCFALSSLDAIALQSVNWLKNRDALIRVLVDARRSRYYTAAYAYEGQLLRKISKDQIMTREAASEAIEKRTVIIGDGAAMFADRAELAPDAVNYPDARLMLEGQQCFPDLYQAVSITGLMPAYLHVTEAEEDLKNKKLFPHAS